MITDALKLALYFGDSHAVESEALMARFAERGVVAGALLRGIEGFGLHRRIHAERFPDIAMDLPLVVQAVDTQERVHALLDDLPHGLVTLERARLATGGDVARLEFPDGAAKLTIYCRADESYRRVVALLREYGASGAIVLPGVDGVLDGRRGRARLFASNRDTPMVIVSVGPAEPLVRTLAHLGEVMSDPIATVEPIAQLKHDGEHLEPLPRADAWQTIGVYTRRIAHVHGRALYVELTRRLREAGGAGATTILGDWGFSSDERPHGDRFGRVASHRPTYTVFIDRPAKVAELWPLIDAVTGRHGIVTSGLVEHPLGP